MEKLQNIIVYIDDLLVHSKTHEEHLSELDEVLQSLTNNNVKINLANVILGTSKYHIWVSG